MASVLLFQKLYFFDGKIFYRMTAVCNSAGCENWLLLMNQHKNIHTSLESLFSPMRKSKDFTGIMPYFSRVSENRMTQRVLVLPSTYPCLSTQQSLQFMIKETPGPDCLLIHTTEGCFCSYFSDCPPLSFKESWSFSTTNSRTSLSMQSWRLMCSRASEKWAMPFSSASLLSRLW